MDNPSQTKPRIDRRRFLSVSATAVAGSALLPQLSTPVFAISPPQRLPFKISLAEWSLHRTIRSNKISNLDFPQVAREEFGIDAIEYVNQFFKKEVDDPKYMTELKQRCTDNGVQSLLIMVDGEGKLGDPNEKKRMKSVENHRRWLRAAQELGCHSIRVNAGSQGSYEEQVKLAADGLSRLSELATEFCQNVIVENHGGLSSNGAWLAEVIKTVNMKNCGTLPDFGNFKVSQNDWYDRYKGVKELMPYAKAVSAKSHQFDEQGNETATDYFQMMKIVLDAGYRGYVGIEFEGGGGEYAGVHATKKLLERCQQKFACVAPNTFKRRRRWLPKLRNHLKRS